MVSYWALACPVEHLQNVAVWYFAVIYLREVHHLTGVISNFPLIEAQMPKSVQNEKKI